MTYAPRLQILNLVDFHFYLQESHYHSWWINWSKFPWFSYSKKLIGIYWRRKIIEHDKTLEWGCWASMYHTLQPQWDTISSEPWQICHIRWRKNEKRLSIFNLRTRDPPQWTRSRRGPEATTTPQNTCRCTYILLSQETHILIWLLVWALSKAQDQMQWSPRRWRLP